MAARALGSTEADATAILDYLPLLEQKSLALESGLFYVLVGYGNEAVGESPS